MEAEFVEIESYFTLYAEFYSSFFDRSTVAKIQKNDDCLRGVMHQSGTSVGLSLGEDVVGELDCDLDGKSEML